MYRINAPGINNAFQVENFYFGGQPNQEGFQFFLDQGVKTIYNLRGIGEDDFSEQEAFFKEKGIEYKHIPFLGENGFNPDCLQDLSELKQGASEAKVLIHCASGNRIGAWYIIYLVQVKGLDLDTAFEEGIKAGLTNPGLGQAVRQFLGV
jgi:protein tyrosine phosphatase (PTP) superfamily phosphohydrolase (DUF442 family)